MKKLIGFGVLLALIISPVAMANAQVTTTVNLFPFAFGTSVGHDTYLAITNLTQFNFVTEPADPPDPADLGPITIRSASVDGTVVSSVSDLAPGETRIYASNSSVDPRNFGCTGGCTVTICAPSITGTVLPGNGPVPVITSSLFWLNNGQFYAITSPLNSFFSPLGLLSDGCPDDFGVAGSGGGPVIIP